MRRLYVHLLRFKFHIFAAESFFVSYGVPKDLNGARRACVLGVGIEQYRRIERPTVDVRFLSCHSLTSEFKIFELLPRPLRFDFNSGFGVTLLFNLFSCSGYLYMYYYTNEMKALTL